MSESRYQRVITRAFLYLLWNGYAIDSDTARRVLRTVDAELACDDEQLLSRVLDRLEHDLALMPLVVPPTAPPLQRSSIGYR